MRDHLDIARHEAEPPNSLGVWQTCLRLAFRAATDPQFPPLSTFHRELAAAELAGEISEFYALGLQAILSMADGAGVADDYLDMAELVAESVVERATVAQWRTLNSQWQPGSCHRATPRQTLRWALGSPDDDKLIALGAGLVDMLRQIGVLGARLNGEQGSSQAA